MRDGEARRLMFAMFFAAVAGILVAYAHPVDRLKADLRADATGLVLSLEYTAHAAEG